MLYLAYIPFEQAFPYKADSDFFAARAAASAFDLLTVLGLFLLGRRLQGGPAGTELGLVLAYAWASWPVTFYVVRWAFNDALIAMLLVYALLAISSPKGRGVLLGLAAAAKFAPVALYPLFLTAGRDRRGRAWLAFAVAFALVTAGAFLPFRPTGGIGAVYRRTIGFQASRQSFSLWGYDALHRIEPVVRASVAVFSVAVGLFAARRTPVQLAAFAAAVLIALELVARVWLVSYAVWFAPFVFVALLASHQIPEGTTRTLGT